MWMGGAPDWSAIAVALGAGPGGIGPGAGNVTAALEPSRRQLENWRSRLNDLWNIAGGWGEGEAAVQQQLLLCVSTAVLAAAGLSTTDSLDWGTQENVLGQPLCTSHYGFALTDYYLVYALAGQARAAARRLLLHACPTCLRLPRRSPTSPRAHSPSRPSTRAPSPSPRCCWARRGPSPARAPRARRRTPSRSPSARCASPRVASRSTARRTQAPSTWRRATPRSRGRPEAARLAYTSDDSSTSCIGPVPSARRLVLLAPSAPVHSCAPSIGGGQGRRASSVPASPLAMGPGGGGQQPWSPRGPEITLLQWTRASGYRTLSRVALFESCFCVVCVGRGPEAKR